MGTCVLFVYKCKSGCSCVYLAVLTYCLAICLFPMCWFFFLICIHIEKMISDFWFLISNHQPHDCLLNRLFVHRSKKISKLRVTGLCAGNSPVTGEFPAQRASNAEMVPFGDVIMDRNGSNVLWKFKFLTGCSPNNMAAILLQVIHLKECS